MSRKTSRDWVARPEIESLEARLLLEGSDGAMAFQLFDASPALFVENASPIEYLREEVVTGQRPWDVIAQDFNSDGRTDLVVTNEQDDDVSILYGQPGGGVGRRQDMDAGDGVNHVVSGDFNGDGWADLAMANWFDFDITVLYWDWQPSFGDRQDFACGQNPCFITAADFNADGLRDLVASNQWGGDLSVFYGRMGGGFGAKQSIFLGGWPRGIAVGHFNEDSLLDMAIADYSASHVSVVYGLGSGGFGNRRNFEVGTRPGFLATGDFDCDGWPDLAVSNSCSHDVTVLYGQPDGSFGRRQDIPVGQEPAGIIAEDLDGDGLLDLAVANFADDTVTLLHGQTDGGFGGRQDVAAGDTPTNIAAGDFDRDGFVDLAVTNYMAHTVSLLYANAAPSACDDEALGSEDAAVLTPNVLENDHDPNGDTVTVDSFTQGRNGSVVYSGNGTFTYTPQADFYGRDTFTYTIADDHAATDTATVYVTVVNVNDPPDAADDAITVDEDSGPTDIDALANDTFLPDPPEVLTVVDATVPADGRVTVLPDKVRYEPRPHFYGLDSFTYTVADDYGATETATVYVTVRNVNDPPDAADDAITVNEDSGATDILVLANDTYLPDPPETLVVVAGSVPAHGAASFLSDNVQYQPRPGFYGSDSFTYTISDGNGGFDTATVTVKVVPVTPIEGDVDLDGQVSFFDYLTVKAGFGIAADATWADGDSDADGDVDFLDYVAAKENFGQSVGGGADMLAEEATAEGTEGAENIVYRTCLAGRQALNIEPRSEHERAGARGARWAGDDRPSGPVRRLVEAPPVDVLGRLAAIRASMPRMACCERPGAMIARSHGLDPPGLPIALRKRPLDLLSAPNLLRLEMPRV